MCCILFDAILLSQCKNTLIKYMEMKKYALVCLMLVNIRVNTGKLGQV